MWLCTSLRHASHPTHHTATLIFDHFHSPIKSMSVLKLFDFSTNNAPYRVYLYCPNKSHDLFISVFIENWNFSVSKDTSWEKMNEKWTELCGTILFLLLLFFTSSSSTWQIWWLLFFLFFLSHSLLPCYYNTTIIIYCWLIRAWHIVQMLGLLSFIL